jgi:CubicO group peptidase (beta-lactamase class C family)
LFPAGSSCGHTGFTGVSLWLDPATRAFVVVLSSRLHPAGQGDAKPLRRAAADAAWRMLAAR